MHLYTILFASLATTISQTFAAPPERRGAPAAYGQNACWTSYTDKPAPYKTHWTEYHSKCTKTRTTTKVVKTTLPANTSTITSTTTVTASTSTLTDTETDTVTSTDTSTTTETTTSTTTTTIGFLPVQTTLPDSCYSGSGGPVVKRDLLDIKPVAKRDLLDVKGLDIDVDAILGTSPKQYPKGVTCYKGKHGRCVQKVTTITSTSTVTPAPTTTTSTDTSTVYPSATTTITTTSTEVATTITTTTSTSTTTVSTTESANCNANNFADTAGGTSIVGASQNTGNDSNLSTTSTPDALTCCLTALAIANGEIFFYDPGSLNCIVASDSTGTCPAQGSDTWSAYVASGNGAATIGNLGCGEYTTVVG